jgi:hypothetical protein
MGLDHGEMFIRQTTYWVALVFRLSVVFRKQLVMGQDVVLQVPLVVDG